MVVRGSAWEAARRPFALADRTSSVAAGTAWAGEKAAPVPMNIRNFPNGAVAPAEPPLLACGEGGLPVVAHGLNAVRAGLAAEAAVHRDAEVGQAWLTGPGLVAVYGLGDYG